MVPKFYLYGEPPREVDAHFLHVETLSERTTPLLGQIRPHIHAALNHVFVVRRGSGIILAENQRIAFEGPHVLFIPAGLVHGFSFGDDVEGHVLTVASAYLDELLRSRDVPDTLHGLRVLPVANPAAGRRLMRWLRGLSGELMWQAPGHRLAIDAHLLGLLTEVWRLGHAEARDRTTPASAAHQLVTRFRERIEHAYRSALPLSAYLAPLHVSETQLRYACEKVGAPTPMRLIIERRLIEAQRLLLYSDMGVAEVGAYLGFEDPAYFSRLFSRETGSSPRAFRQMRGGSTTKYGTASAANRQAV